MERNRVQPWSLLRVPSYEEGRGGGAVYCRKLRCENHLLTYCLHMLPGERMLHAFTCCLPACPPIPRSTFEDC